MKKINRFNIFSCFLLYITLFFMFPLESMAQMKISVVAGLNNSKISLSNYFLETNNSSGLNYARTSQMQTGYSFFGGLKAEIELANSLALSSGVLFDDAEYIQNFQQRTTNNPVDTINGRDIIKLLYLSVPFHLVFYAPFEKARIYVGVGGYIRYGLLGTNSFQVSSTNLPTVRDSIDAITFSSNSKISYATYYGNRIDYGLSLVAGIELRNNFFFEFGFESGLNSVFKDRYVAIIDEAIVHNYSNTIRQFLFSIGYRIK